MKKLIHLLIIVNIVITNAANAQCDLKATVIPERPILCPNDTDTLYTQKYDSYQWFKNGKPIAGATSRGYVVTQDDVGYFFKVAVTKNGCTDTSKKVFVDGYAFLPPYIIESGDVGVYNIKKDALIECPEDTLVLELGLPYSLNIQWYNNWKPIDGATEPVYYVTKTGSYTACGAPEVCPSYNVCETVPINTIFENPIASITQRHDTLFSSQATQYQWFLNNKPIEGATQPYYVPTTGGKYKVATKDKFNCVAVSNGYFYTAAPHKNILSVLPNPVKDVLHVHIDSKDAAQIIISDLYGNRMVQLPVTSKDQDILFQNARAGTYVLQVFNRQGQLVASKTIIKQ